MNADRPVAVVTGAGSGIGAAIAALLQDRGWAVASISREPAPDTDLWLVADVADETAVDEAISQVRKAFGRIDAAVICAGHYAETPALEIDQPAWERMLRVHVGGLAHVCRAVLPGHAPAGQRAHRRYRLGAGHRRGQQ